MKTNECAKFLLLDKLTIRIDFNKNATSILLTHTKIPRYANIIFLQLLSLNKYGYQTK